MSDGCQVTKGSFCANRMTCCPVPEPISKANNCLWDWSSSTSSSTSQIPSQFLSACGVSSMIWKKDRTTGQIFMSNVLISYTKGYILPSLVVGFQSLSKKWHIGVEWTVTADGLTDYLVKRIHSALHPMVVRLGHKRKLRTKNYINTTKVRLSSVIHLSKWKQCLMFYIKHLNYWFGSSYFFQPQIKCCDFLHCIKH